MLHPPARILTGETRKTKDEKAQVSEPRPVGRGSVMSGDPAVVERREILRVISPEGEREVIGRGRRAWRSVCSAGPTSLRIRQPMSSPSKLRLGGADPLLRVPWVASHD